MASKFIGDHHGDGSNLTNVNAQTLDGVDSSQFVRLDTTNDGDISFPTTNCPFSSHSHTSLQPMSVRLWDSYNAGGPTSYGSVLDIYGRSGHSRHQFNMYNQDLKFRSGWYGNDNWSGWNTIWHDGNLQTSEAGGAGKVAKYNSGNGYLYAENWIHLANNTGLFYSSGVHFHDNGSGMHCTHNISAAGELDISGKANFQGDAAVEGGSGYGIFKGYTSNNNHMMVSRGIVTGTTASPSIVGGHEMTFVEYCNTSSAGFVFKSSHTGSYTEVGRLTTSGLTVVGDVTAYSDERLKDNIVEISDAMDKVSQLRGVTFTRKDDGLASTGVIAQDVQKVLPEAIKEDDDGMLSVKYGNMVGLLIEGMKELKAENAELRAMIEELRNGK